LYGISKHSGSLGGGHYVGDVKDIDSNTWYSCNDSNVESYKGSPSLSSSSAYVLFYIQWYYMYIYK
jgi:ubiquitin C-terminal hydrolase